MFLLYFVRFYRQGWIEANSRRTCRIYWPFLMWDDGLGGLYEMMGWVDVVRFPNPLASWHSWQLGNLTRVYGDDDDDTLLLYLVITMSVKCGWFVIYSTHLSFIHVDCWEKILLDDTFLKSQVKKRWSQHCRASWLDLGSKTIHPNVYKCKLDTDLDLKCKVKKVDFKGWKALILPPWGTKWLWVQ